MAKTYNPKPRQKPDTPAKSCGNCAHVFRVENDTTIGICRRYPPSLKVDGNSSANVPVKLAWVCGEWKA